MRNINSPGVQITEIDKSAYAQPTVGTTVFVAGFAAQGPVDEVQQISTLSEFEQVYGVPATPAEAYFYENSKQIIQSTGNLLCTRLPYGAGVGDGFANQYSALLYPATTGLDVTFTSVTTIGVQSVRIHEDEGIEGVDFSAGIHTEVTVLTATGLLEGGEDSTVSHPPSQSKPGLDGFSILSLSTVRTQYTTVYGNMRVDIGAPRQITLTREQFLSIKDGQFDWDETVHDTDASPTPQWLNYVEDQVDYNFMQNVGIIVLNTAKTVNEDSGVGYYINIADNSNWGPQHTYTSIVGVKGLSANNKFAASMGDNDFPIEYGSIDIPSERFVLPLSGLAGDSADSLSQSLEKIPKFNLGAAYYDDTVLLTVTKIQQSQYQPNALQATIIEAHIGSLDSNKKTASDTGGVQRGFFLGDVVTNNSNRVQVIVNPAISKSIKWIKANSGSTDPNVSVRVVSDAKHLYADGVHESPRDAVTQKDVGDVSAKLEHALRLVENTDSYNIDLVVDAGLSTISTNKDSQGSYSDTKRLANSLLDLSTPGSSVFSSWLDIYNVLNTFAQTIRKDCMAIVDPLRQVFLHGSTKLSERKGTTFTQTVYTSMRNLVGACDSSFSAIYCNWGLVHSVALDKQLWIPLSGAVAAVYAKSDSVAQPWTAPAGFNRGVLSGIILDLACNPTQKQRDNLYTISVNPVVFFPGDGFVVYGQKTMQQKPTAFDRVNVRRLFLSLERSTYKTLKYFVFEPNTTVTRSRVISTLSPLFQSAKLTQGVYDYMIVCDDRNNTSDSIDSNELIVDIYLKPVKAAEFILVSFTATRTGQNFSEVM